MMTRFLLAILLALAPAAAAAQSPTPQTAVTITRAGERWTAEVTFGRDSPVWLFNRSAVTRVEKTSWRARSIRVLTPGVTLKRLGAHDALVAARGTVPRKVRLSFTPFAEDLIADYDPALVFTDGSVALFTGHWDLFPQGSVKAAEALTSEADPFALGGGPSRLTFRYPRGRILYDGKRRPVQTLVQPDAYVLFGEARTVESPAITTIIDPQLPAWLASEISTFTPQLLDAYTKRLGPRDGPKPMVMVSWAGPTPRLRSMGGSVLPGLVLMRLEGSALVKPDEATKKAARWFIAHESAHFWVGQTVGYASPRESWITEGSADLLAIRAVGAVDARFDQKREIQDRFDQCVALAAKGPIATAGQRLENDVFYKCGAMFALAAEGAARKTGGDLFSFYRGLIAANRADRTLDRSEWLSELTRLAGSPEPARIIAAMLDNPTPDAAGQLAALFDATGVATGRGADGKLVLP